MKSAVLAFALIAAVACSKRGTEGRPQSFFGTPLATDEETARVTAAVEAVLAKHLTVRSDGTAVTSEQGSKVRTIEMNRFRIGPVRFQQTNAADRLNGITKRFLASVDSDAHRIWNGDTRTWSDWKPSRYLLFPGALTVEYRDGRIVVAEPQTLAGFRPGPAR